MHQAEKREYAQRITAFMEDYQEADIQTKHNGERKIGRYSF